MKVNHLKMFLPLLACILALLIVLVCVPAQVHAQTTKKHPKQQITTVYLKNSTWEPNYYYFQPSSVSCKIRTVCLVIVNKTGNSVWLVDNYGVYCYLSPGNGTCTEDYSYIGTRYYNDTDQNINVLLAVHVHV